METPPITPTELYNQTFYGFFGNLGAGGGSQIVYLQSAIRPLQLDKLTLISEIEGSETWSVRDLFQREVDDKRVTKALLPYFQDPERVKFFNPLTLTVLPLDRGSGEILAEPPRLEFRTIEKDGRDWDCHEAEGFYRYRWIPGYPHYAALDWNDDTVKIVAIDGQHRLSALKRFKRDAVDKDEFTNWTIPVVAFAVKPLQDTYAKQNVLDVVRSIFIYINKEARQPSEARQIILSDESINNICTQEILEYAHANDVAVHESREARRVPLLLFDWRGQEEEGRPVPSPAALKSIVEIRDWLENFILGPDFSVDQKAALGVTPTSSLAGVFSTKRLPISKTDEVRERFRETLLPGFVHLLEAFTPYRTYIQLLRELEAESTSRSDVARHAFHELRFGSHNAPKEQERDVAQEREKIERQAQDLSRRLPEMLRQDIGMRGILSAMGRLRPVYNRSRGHTADFREYADWFVRQVNQLFADGWFDWRRRKTADTLLYLYKDRAERVVNYRLAQVDGSLGAFVAMMILAYDQRDARALTPLVVEEMQEELSEVLEGTLSKGYKREVRTELKKTLPTKTEEYRTKLKEESSRLTEQHMTLIATEWRRIAGTVNGT